VEGRVDAARHYWTVGVVGVVVAAKLPALNDPLGLLWLNRGLF